MHGVDLQGTIVILDEAHNIVSTVYYYIAISSALACIGPTECYEELKLYII